MRDVATDRGRHRANWRKVDFRFSMCFHSVAVTLCNEPKTLHEARRSVDSRDESIDRDRLSRLMNAQTRRHIRKARYAVLLSVGGSRVPFIVAIGFWYILIQPLSWLLFAPRLHCGIGSWSISCYSNAVLASRVLIAVAGTIMTIDSRARDAETRFHDKSMKL